MTQIAIIDDHKLVSAGFIHLIELEDDLSVAFSCGSYSEAIEKLDNTIDVVIIDISLPDKNGIELAKYLNNTIPSVRKIIVSMYENTHYINEAKQYGVLAYLSKKAAPEELINAIGSVLNNAEYYSQDLLEKIHDNQALDKNENLTCRELEVLKMLAKGLSPKQVATALSIMPKTALAHRYNLFNKFNVNNQYDLLQKALEQGLLNSTDISLCSI